MTAGPHPRDLPPCDLVMKGGVASGVVYPGAVLELSARYRFASLGGTSAGAVAAAMAAACEYARQRSGSTELRGITEIVESFEQPGFILSLFAPTREARPLMTLGLRLAAAKGSRRRQSALLVRAAIGTRRTTMPILVALQAVVVSLALTGTNSPRAKRCGNHMSK